MCQGSMILRTLEPEPPSAVPVISLLCPIKNLITFFVSIMIKVALLYLLAAQSEAFSPVIPTGRSHATTLFAEASVKKELDVAHLQHQLAEQAAHLEAFEHSLLTDPDLDNFVEHEKVVKANYMANEAHKHDSFLAEVAHSIDSDPDLAGITQSMQGHVKIGLIEKNFMEKEAHKHDSLLNEIEWAIDMDPDLSL